VSLLRCACWLLLRLRVLAFWRRRTLTRRRRLPCVISERWRCTAVLGTANGV
jgi:hypothetical protein